MAVTCHVCQQPIRPGRKGVRYEGTARKDAAPKTWEWGPVPVHEECRTRLEFPQDAEIGSDSPLFAAWEYRPG
ncbi:hypothetical protein GCM10010531_39330 [Blastococcus jejuensis]|uniref:Uncharacterized protein n=1 Tax=Blastococcus jejuensis TaxID=351224 RepID=A0ABP6PMZ1_9ACTN